MKRTISSLIICAGAASALYLSPALAAESSAEFTALSAEVQALKARQLAIQADLASIRALLSGARQAPTAAAPAAAAPAPVPALPAPAVAAAAPADDAGTAALRAELEEMKKTLADVKAREDKARQGRAPTRDIDVTVDVTEDPFLGSADAQITLVEYTDYQCPFCSRHKKNVMPELLKNYVETGKVRYVLRDFPLAFHKQAPKAHEAAHCAGEQGKYWEMSEQLFGNQKALQAEKLPGYAETAGVTDLAAFQTCLDTDQYAERTKQNTADGSKAGVTGTPSFVIGLTEPDGSTIKLKKFIRGAQGYPIFEETIEELLKPAEG